jgi:GNAT superfamily N-acetyltransferase
MQIRAATPADVPAMVALSDAKRTEYATYSPVFWRKAEGGAEAQARFFTNRQLPNEQIITLVAERDGTVEGFIMAMVQEAPPVYDPGGPVCMIDDFTVATPDLWATTGLALLEAATALARERGAVLTITICGHLDTPKRRMLQEHGATIAAETFVKPL